MNITKNTQSLKRRSDFKRLYRRGRNASGGYIAVYSRRNRLNINRLGLTVSKSVGKAVVRNRVKRLFRECYRSFEDRLPSGYDFVFVAKPNAAEKSLEQLERDLGYVLKKSDLLDK